MHLEVYYMLPHVAISILMQLVASYCYSSFISMFNFSFLFKCSLLTEHLAMSYYQQQLIILSDHTLLVTSGHFYQLYKHSTRTLIFKPINVSRSCVNAWIYWTSYYKWLLICDSKLASYSYVYNILQLLTFDKKLTKNF